MTRNNDSNKTDSSNRHKLADLREPRQAHDREEPLALPKAVLALRGVAHPERTRYAMNGVLLERADGQCRATATDGKRLAVVEWRDTTEGGGGDVATVVPADTLAEAEKLMRGSARAKRTDTIPCVLNGKVSVTVPAKASDVRLEAPSVEGHFPPYREVMPKCDRAEIVLGINAELLHGLAQALHAACGTGAKRGDLCVRLRIDASNPADSAIVVEAMGAAGEVRGFGILMPVVLS